MTHLGELRALEYLSLDATAVSGPGLAHTSRLPKLRELGAGSTRVYDESLRPFASYPALEILRLDSTELRGEGMVYLREVPTLASCTYARHSSSAMRGWWR